LFYIAYLGNEEIYWICKTCCMISVSFCTKCHLFHNLSSVHIIHFSLIMYYNLNTNLVVHRLLEVVLDSYEVLSLWRTYHWSFVRPFAVVSDNYLNYTKSLDYQGHIIGHLWDHSAWWQAAQHALMFEFDVSQSLRPLDHCTGFFFSIFKEDAGNFNSIHCNYC
jgi:hypothetical protein